MSRYLQQFPSTPLRTKVESYQAYLKQAETNLKVDGPWRGTLRTILSTPLVRNVRSLTTKDKKRYYLTADAPYNEDETFGVVFSAITSNDVSRLQTVRVKKDNLANKPTPSPQSLLSEDLLGRVDRLDASQWESFGFDVASAIVAQPDLDPILQVILLDRTLQLIQSNGWGLDDSAQEALHQLQTVQADNLAWMNPDDGGAKAGRATAADAVRRLPRFSEMKMRMAAERSSLFASLALDGFRTTATYRVDGKWFLAAQPNSDREECAFVVVPVSADQGELREIARSQKGEFVFDQSALVGVPEGSLVFVARTGK